MGGERRYPMEVVNVRKHVWFEFPSSSNTEWEPTGARAPITMAHGGTIGPEGRVMGFVVFGLCFALFNKLFPAKKSGEPAKDFSCHRCRALVK
jgi:hypothetical protein